MPESFDPFQLYGQLNPVSTEQLNELADGPEREATWARIIARRDAVPQRIRLSRRRLVAAVVVAVALAVPALAFSGVLGSLFAFSNQGTPVTKDNLSRATAVLHLTGAKPGSLVQLAARDGWGVYADRTTSGDLCFYDGPAGNSNLNEIGGGCMNAAASASFPSPSRPVWDMSLFETEPSQRGATVTGPSVARLTGVAADGVTSVQVLALADCHVVATAPVSDNTYVANNLPMIPEAVIVARDASGNAVWHEAVTPAFNPNANSCGLG
jgi:hypothetical protein